MDKRPKRFKEFDNPYTLESIEKEELYFIKFRDELGEHIVSVSKEVFDVFDESEKYENNMMSKNSKHLHKFELSDEALSNKMVNNQISIEEMIINDIMKKKLHEAIEELPEKERTRLYKYYFQNKTLEQIAKEEKVYKSTIKRSIDKSLEKISKKLKI